MNDMNRMNLTGLDFNLLKILAVLVEEKSVTAAAKRLGRTQPAVSNALNRLRGLLSDELLVRDGASMALTPRAEALRQPLREITHLIEACVSEPPGFDPSTMSGIFRFGLPDRLGLPLLPSLIARLSDAAPHMDLHVMTADRDYALRLLDEERIDLALGWPEKVPPQFQSETLFEDQLVYTCRQDHPIVSGGVPETLESLLMFPHLVVSATGGRLSMFDSVLAALNLKRRAQLSVTNFSTVPSLLLASDMIGVFTRRVCEVFSRTYPLEVRPLPMKSAALNHQMVWHVRFNDDPRHLWFRQQVEAVCANF